MTKEEIKKTSQTKINVDDYAQFIEKAKNRNAMMALVVLIFGIILLFTYLNALLESIEKPDEKGSSTSMLSREIRI